VENAGTVEGEQGIVFVMIDRKEGDIGTEAMSARDRVDPEVVARAARRRFTADYKLGIVRAAEACRASGEIGALLRSAGLYSSHLVTWRRAAKNGSLKALAAVKRGPKAKESNPLAKRVADLERENAKLKKRLDQAETIITFQKKLADLLSREEQDAPNSESR
jgi:transposase-like protein